MSDFNLDQLISESLALAYREIKDRKGELLADGTFRKESP